MLKRRYRSKLSIVFDILKSINELGEASITEIIIYANIPHNRLKRLLKTLQEKEYIKERADSNKTIYSLTPKGYKLMVELHRIKRLLEDLGLEA